MARLPEEGLLGGRARSLSRSGHAPRPCHRRWPVASHSRLRSRNSGRRTVCSRSGSCGDIRNAPGATLGGEFRRVAARPSTCAAAGGVRGLRLGSVTDGMINPCGLRWLWHNLKWPRVLIFRARVAQGSGSGHGPSGADPSPGGRRPVAPPRNCGARAALSGNARMGASVGDGQDDHDLWPSVVVAQPDMAASLDLPGGRLTFEIAARP